MAFFDGLRQKGAEVKAAQAAAAAPANNPAAPGNPTDGPANGTGADNMPNVRSNNTDQAAIQQFIQQWQQNNPPTAESMQRMVAELNRQGYPVTIATRAGGSAASGDKLVFPDGMVVDIIGDEGGAGAKWTYNANPNDRFGGDHMVVGPDGQMVKYSDYLGQRGLPIPTATPGAGGVGAAPGGGGPGYTMGYDYGGGAYPLSSVQGQGLMAPFSAAFQNPGGFQVPGYEDAANDPAHQFRMREGQQAIERSAAAKGTLLTGGTLKDLAAYAQGLASEEYDKIYGRRLGENRMAYDRAWNEYMGAHNIYDTNRKFQYGSMRDMAGLGLNAASGYANTATNLETGKGNSQSAGTITQGQNNANLTQGIADTAGGLAGAWAGSRGTNPASTTAPAPAPYNPATDWQGPMPNNGNWTGPTDYGKGVYG
jgi:hypothetical protein